MHEESCVSPAAFIGSCFSSQSLCTQFVNLLSRLCPSFPPIPGTESTSVYLSSLTGGPLPVVDNAFKAKHFSVFRGPSLLFFLA